MVVRPLDVAIPFLWGAVSPIGLPPTATATAAALLAQVQDIAVATLPGLRSVRPLGACRMTALDTLAARLQQDLALLELPAKDWIPRRRMAGVATCMTSWWSAAACAA